MSENIIELPPEIYKALRKKAQALSKSTDVLVSEILSDQLSILDNNGEYSAFETEAAAFDRLLSSQVEHFSGHFVAVYQEKVVAKGYDKFELLRNVYSEFGPVPCYIGKIDPNRSLRKARIPSTWIVKQ